MELIQIWIASVRNKSSWGRKARCFLLTVNHSTFTNEGRYALHEQHCWDSSYGASRETLWAHQAWPAVRNEAVCGTFHCEESLGRSQGSLLHAGGSCCLPVAHRCHWGGPVALLGWCACCSPPRNWQALSGFRRECFQCGHYSSCREEGEGSRGSEGVLTEYSCEKFNRGIARTLLQLWMCSALGLVTGAADFCEL